MPSLEIDALKGNQFRSFMCTQHCYQKRRNMQEEYHTLNGGKKVVMICSPQENVRKVMALNLKVFNWILAEEKNLRETKMNMAAGCG